MRPSAQQTNQIVRITWLGLGINALLTVLKFVFGLLGHSEAAVADAVHSFSDLGTDIAILFGVRFWSVPADDGHPYGHRRIETLITVLIGVSLAAVAVGFSLAAIDKLRHPPEISPTLIALTGSLLTIFLKEGLFRLTRRVGRRVGSPAVIANAWHHRSDAYSSIPVIVAVGASSFNPEWHFLDQIGALVVALMILKAAWDITKPALAELIDTGASRPDYRQIVELARSINGVLSVHKVRTRLSGAGLYVDLHVLVDGNMTVDAGHEIATQVQRKLIFDGPSVVDVVVHIEPAHETTVSSATR